MEEAAIPPTEFVNAIDDGEDNVEQNTSGSSDPLRPVDLCYDVTTSFVLLVCMCVCVCT